MNELELIIKFNEIEKELAILRELIYDLEGKISSIEGNVNFLYTRDD